MKKPLALLTSCFVLGLFSLPSLATSSVIKLGDSNMKMTAVSDPNALVEQADDNTLTINTLDKPDGLVKAPVLNAVSVEADRVTYIVWKWQRGNTVAIDMAHIENLCGDIDGCTLRLGMHNWDNTGRDASRSSLFYYNNVTRTWHAEKADTLGTDYNGVTEDVMNAWSCYFTDGTFVNWADYGDGTVGFGLLSWDQYNADCRLSIID